MLRKIYKYNYDKMKMYIDVQFNTNLSERKHSVSFFCWASLFLLLHNGESQSIITKAIVVSFIAIIKQCRYYNLAGYKLIVFKFIANRKRLKKTKLELKNPEAGEFNQPPIEYATAFIYWIQRFLINNSNSRYSARYSGTITL